MIEAKPTTKLHDSIGKVPGRSQTEPYTRRKELVKLYRNHGTSVVLHQSAKLYELSGVKSKLSPAVAKVVIRSRSFRSVIHSASPV